MKIWIDVTTPKEVIFFKRVAEKLSKKHTVMCTSRIYSEANDLAKIHKFKTVILGRHGGMTKEGKLNAAIERMGLLNKKMAKFCPDLLISWCSPDASRVAFGLGIKHIGIIDEIHATITNRLSIPLIDKLVTPKIYPKKAYAVYGIDEKNIFQYNAIDGIITTKIKTIPAKLPFSKSKKNIVVRMPEDHASYMPNVNYMPIIHAIIKKFQSENVVIITRYQSQIAKLSKLKIGKFKIIGMKYDGKALLENCDVFVGLGGTMTLEAALLGIPCVTGDIFSLATLDFLIKKKLLKIAHTPKEMTSIMEELLNAPVSKNKKRAKALAKTMDDPYDVIVTAMNALYKPNKN